MRNCAQVHPPMQKLFRLFALVVVMAFSVASTLSAQTMGTNPKPRPPQHTVLEYLQQIALAYLGI